MESRVFQAKGKACTKSCVRRELRFLGNCKKATKARMQTRRECKIGDGVGETGQRSDYARTYGPR